MFPPYHYHRQAAAFRALAQDETNREVKLLFAELAESYQMQAERAGEASPVNTADSKLVA